MTVFVGRDGNDLLTEDGRRVLDWSCTHGEVPLGTVAPKAAPIAEELHRCAAQFRRVLVRVAEPDRLSWSLEFADHARAAAFHGDCLDAGLLLLHNEFGHPPLVRLMPPVGATPQEIDRALGIVHAVLLGETYDDEGDHR